MNTNPNTYLIQTQDLVKRFGEKTAVDQVTFQVDAGEVFGFLGPNGAGKTTTIKMIVGLLQPTSGSVEVAGFDLQEQPLQAKAVCGYLPDTPNLYPKLTARELLRFVGDLYEINNEQIERRSQEMLNLFELADAADDPIESRSAAQEYGFTSTACSKRPPWPAPCSTILKCSSWMSQRSAWILALRV